MDIPPFPEIGSSADPGKVPWADAVAWSRGGAYEWLLKEHVRRASWGSGSLSVEIHERSFLYSQVRYLILKAPFMAVGANVPVG
jgi:hypothetical protein